MDEYHIDEEIFQQADFDYADDEYDVADAEGDDWED